MVCLCVHALFEYLEFTFRNDAEAVSSHVTHSGNKMQPQVDESHETLCKGRYRSTKLLLASITHRFLCLSFHASVKVRMIFALLLCTTQTNIKRNSGIGGG